MHRIMYSLAAIAAFAVTPAAADDASLTKACDLAAANPSDRWRPAYIPGVAFNRINAQAAVTACEAAIAAAPGKRRLVFELGRAYQAMRNFNKAREFFERAAGAGYAAAQLSLGTLYEAGVGGLPKDEGEAARLFKLAADQGNPAAQTRLGIFYAAGRGGLPKDDGEATRLFKLAAAQGDPNAMNSLGIFYAEGRGGLPRNEKEAERLFRLAAAKGSWAARVSLAHLHNRFARDLAASNLTTFDQADATRIAASLKQQVYRCWDPSAGLRGTDLTVTVRMLLNKDGSLVSASAIRAGSGPASKVAAASALRAVRTCQPFRLPAERYDMWHVVEMVFDPRQMFR